MFTQTREEGPAWYEERRRPATAPEAGSALPPRPMSPPSPAVSSQTVSRVANARSNVEPETRERVLSAMRMLGYQRNSAARALTLGRFHVLGVVTFDLAAQGNARTLAAISHAAQAAGYSVNVVCAEAQTEDAVQQAVRQLTEQAVDGLIVVEAQILDRRGSPSPAGPRWSSPTATPSAASTRWTPTRRPARRRPPATSSASATAPSGTSAARRTPTPPAAAPPPGTPP